MKSILILVVLIAALAAGAVFFLAREVPAEAVPLPDDATAVLSDPRFTVPDGWSWQTVQTATGSVRWGMTSPATPRGVVLFLPGYSAPTEIYFESLTRMRRAGFAVVALDWPGQAGSSRGSDNPHKIHATSLDGHVEAARQISREMDRRFAQLPRFVVGLSMGAQLGTRLISGSGRFKAAALITPAYGLANGKPTAVERLVLNTLRAAGFGERYAPGNTDWVFDLDAHNGVDSQCSHPNDRTKLWYAHTANNEALKVGGMSNDFAMALIESGKTAASNQVIGDIEIPIWMPLAEDDRFIDNAEARRVCDALSNCELKFYPEARHCLFEEADEFYRPFMTDLINFLDQQVSTVAE